MLAGVSQAEQKEQKGSLCPFTQQGRSRGCGQHEYIGIELPFEQAGDGVGGDVVAACNVR